MNGATYPDGGPPVAAVAFWNEYGKPEQGQPPRPFFRNMIAAESPTWAPKLARQLRDSADTHTALGALGVDIESALRRSIRETNEPALSPITLMLRKMYGNDSHLITGASVGKAARRVAEGESGATGTQAKPLIWTSHMINSITHKVE